MNIEFGNPHVGKMLEACPDGILVVNATGHIVSHNRRFVEMWTIPSDSLCGSEPGTAIGIEVSQLLPHFSRHIKDPEAFLAQVRELNDAPHLNDRSKIELLDGRTLERHSTVLRNDRGLRQGKVWFYRDITERRQEKESLRLTQFVSDYAPDSIFWIDEQARIVYVNEAACRERGYTKEELLGMTLYDIDVDIPVDVWAAHWQELKQKGSLTLQVNHKRKDGSIFPLEVSANFIKFGDTELNVAFSRDISERKQIEEQIQQLAFYDPLTSLPNRRLLADRLQHAMHSSQRNQQNCALLFIDLDQFKILNDSLGHGAGDLLLQGVAQRLKACMRQSDTVGRLGGDEFLIVLEGLNGQPVEAALQAESISENILAVLGRPHRIENVEWHITPSIGITLFSGGSQTMDELMKQADIAMYQAKRAGRNTLRFFDQQMQESINLRATLEKKLHQAIDCQQFQLYYQVQVDGANRPLGAEALIRWLHPQDGLVSPDLFIPLAEETGLILPIGQWVLNEVCAQLKAWQENAVDLVLAMNVSAKQFRQAEFADQVRAAVERHAINPEMLKLEITESLLLEDFDGTIATMNALNEIGVQFSLDDFGTGYSSLQYLKRLPFDQLKIDQSFVRDLASDVCDKAIVNTIIAMANSLNFDVIAEGVESEEQLQILVGLGCRKFQGFHFGKPVPIEHFGRFLGHD